MPTTFLERFDNTVWGIETPGRIGFYNHPVEFVYTICDYSGIGDFRIFDESFVIITKHTIDELIFRIDSPSMFSCQFDPYYWAEFRFKAIDDVTLESVYVFTGKSYNTETCEISNFRVSVGEPRILILSENTLDEVCADGTFSNF